MPGSITQDPDSGAHHRRLGAYRLLEKLPVYGMVQPYVARKDGQVELQILKRLLLELTGNVTAKSRFVREARIAENLRHPNVVQAVEVGEDDGVFFIVTEWVRGPSLFAVQDRLRDFNKRMPLEVFTAIVTGVLEGVKYAHAATDRQGLPLSIVHRDLAPRSIVTSFAGEVKIGDFGVARAKVDDFKTLPGMAVGSVPYMSPEQAQGRPLDPRTDLYTLAVVFYELLTGRPAVVEADMLTMLRAVVGEEPPPLASLRPDLPPPLVQAIQRGLAKDPDERWADADSFQRALLAHLPVPKRPQHRLSHFVRKLMPDREAETLELVNRIREHTEAESLRGAHGPVVPVDHDNRPERERATQVVRQRRAVEEEPPEPSVMTMPGVPVSSQPDVLLVQGSVAPRRRAPMALALGAGVVAIGLTAAAWWATQSAEPARASSTVAPASAAASPVEAVPPAVQVDPGVSPTVTPQPPARRARRPAGKPSPRTSPLAPVAPAPPSSATEGPPEVQTAPPKPDETQPAARAAPRRSRLRSQLSTLRANPRDPRAFQALHSALRRGARRLRPSQASAVDAHLDAAERSFDVEELAKALDKLEAALR